MTDDHPSFSDLIERSSDPEVAAHLQICAACRVQARIYADVLTSDADALPDIDRARERLSRARVEASQARSLELLSMGGGGDVEVLHPGRVVERYTVEARVGSGGMSTVYRVRHRHLGSVHALKVLHGVSSTVRGRLLREGRAQSQLRHPHVVAVTDVVEVDGAPGLIMEYVDGPTLADLLRDGPPDLDEADRIARGVLRGVCAAHRSGLVHRDLKPANVLLVPGEGGYHPKVADFGLARLMEEDVADPRITHPETPMGTPAYMSPEQIVDASRADARSDVFSLGALLYELVTGERAFGGLAVVEVYDRIRAGRYPSLRGRRPDLPDRMERAITGALQVEPERRFADCGKLLAAWAGQAAPAGRAPDWRWIAGIAAAVVLAGIAGVYALQTPPAEPEVQVTDLRLTARPRTTRLHDVALAPDGSRFAFTDHQGLWVQPAERGDASLLFPGELWPVSFFPDSERLLVSGKRDGDHATWVVYLDGTVDRLWDGGAHMVEVSPQGDRVALVDMDGLWVRALDGSPPIRLLAMGEGDATGDIAWSPSGRFVAGIYESLSRPGAWLEITAADGTATRKVLERQEIIHLSGSALAWRAPDRLVFGWVHERAQPAVVSLRQVVGAETATEQAFRDAPVVHRWAGILPSRMTASADGSRVVYRAEEPEKDASLLELGGGGELVPVAQDGWGESPTAWMDPDTLVLVSDRSVGEGTGGADRGGDLYLHRAGEAPRLVARGPIPDHGARVVGGALVFTRMLMGEDGQQAGRAVIRLVPGQPEQELLRFEAPGNVAFQFQVRCTGPEVGRCLVSEPTGSSIRFSWLDPVTGERGDTVATGSFNWWAWDVSPDGRWLATFNGHPAHMSLHDLDAGGEQAGKAELELKSATHAAWDPVRDRIYLAGYARPAPDTPRPARLVVVGLDGEEEVLTSVPGAYLYAPAPRPDGLAVAVGTTTLGGDVWMLSRL